MGILARFKSIMEANINAALDKMEDPSKMIDQLLRDLQNDLGQVKAETAGLMAEEARAKRKLDECNAEVERLHTYAERAVSAGNDNDARVFLSDKAKAAANLTGLRQAYELAQANAEKIRLMNDKLTAQIDELNAKRATIKAKVSAAKTQERINKMTDATKSVEGSMSAFARMEEKADYMLDKANAMNELNKAQTQAVTSKDLMSKYDTPASSVDDELAALKRQVWPKNEE